MHLFANQTYNMTGNVQNSRCGAGSPKPTSNLYSVSIFGSWLARSTAKNNFMKKKEHCRNLGAEVFMPKSEVDVEVFKVYSSKLHSLHRNN